MSRLGAGRFDRRIEIWRGGIVDDGMRRKNAPFSKAFARWARKRDVSDAERAKTGQQAQEVGTRFVVRADAQTRTITGADQVRHRGRVYQIVGVKETDERDDGIEISALALTDKPA